MLENQEDKKNSSVFLTWSLTSAYVSYVGGSILQQMLAQMMSMKFPIAWSEVKSFSHVRLFVTPWIVAYQAPPSMGFCRQEYWSGLPFPSPVYLPDPGIEPGSPTLEADALTSEPRGKAYEIPHGLHLISWIFLSILCSS